MISLSVLAVGFCLKILSAPLCIQLPKLVENHERSATKTMHTCPARQSRESQYVWVRGRHQRSERAPVSNVR